MKESTFRITQERSLSNPSGAESKKWDQRRDAAVTHAHSPMIPGYVKDADGGIIEDLDGNRWIDFATGIGVTNVGANNPAVVEAIQQAAGHFTHTNFMVAPYPGYVQVCELLNKHTPGDGEKRSVLFNSGAEAVENAVKIARNYTKKTGVVCFDFAFHGRTNLTMAMTAKNAPYKSGFYPLATDVHRLPASYPFRDGLSGEEAAKRTIRLIEKQIGAENLACVVLETIQGEGGFIVPAPGFIPALAAWCKDNNVLYVADEVQSGFGRSGKFFAIEHEEVVPDLITTAKGIAGGMPLSAVTGRAEIMDSIQVGGVGTTYAGNPISCAASIAVFEQMEKLDIAERANQIGAIIREEWAEVEKLDCVGEIRGRGAMIAMELVDKNGEPDPTITNAVVKECLEQGVIALSCGVDANVIRLLPPLVIPENVLRDGLQVIAKAIKNNAG